jgi:uncharacterized protein YacL
MWLTLIRIAVVLVLAHCGYRYSPFPENPLLGMALGIVAAGALILLEQKARLVPGHHLVGALIGAVVGLLAARLAWGALTGLALAGEHFVHSLLVVVLGYIGLVIGATKGEWLEPARMIAAFRDTSRQQHYKILDTSVIIDGRIADICETGFLDGILVAPQFVLRELQQVADSSDSLKRNRGRRGLDILQKIQKMANVTVQIVETDFPEIREVDLKLIELARRLSGKIVTNDFNLNKVAQLRGVPVLNINELANSLKPVVLPGELMKVFIIKEGKEAGQGVAYLDDGTMVVVDQARKALGKTIEVSVTSVLQTTAGKMIFCRWPDAAQMEDPNARRVGDRRDPRVRDPRAPERREGERRNGDPGREERTGLTPPGGIAPIPPGLTPPGGLAPIPAGMPVPVAPLDGAPPAHPAGAAEPHDHAETSSARPIAKAE